MDWSDLTELPRRAPHLGINEFGHYYKAGQWTPFYIPRVVMPQIDDYDDLVAFAPDKFVEVNGLDPRAITPHQRVDVQKARTMSNETLFKRILISRDMFILDGHHRWYEHEKMDMPLNAWQVQLDFLPAVKFLFTYPKTYSYGDGNEHPFAP